VSDIAQEWLIALCIAVAVALAVGLSLRPLIGWLKRRAIMDVPNERSSHVEVTPRGGGIAVTGGLLLGCLAWSVYDPSEIFALVLLGMMALALVSWLDDRRGGLPVGLRLGLQAVAIGVVLVLLPDFVSITQGVAPIWLERIILFFAWIWFTNLFNFMDGINGITAVEMAATGLGAALVTALRFDGLANGPALIVAAAAIGFLPWNWGKARIFLGDVGSVPAGYLIGVLLLLLGFSGAWAAALILPMYYWVDATVTLLRRLLRGEKVWRAHRSHFYQQGARKLGSHAAVAGRIAVLNLLLIGLAVISLQGGWVACGAIAVALILTAALCRHFAEPV